MVWVASASRPAIGRRGLLGANANRVKRYVALWPAVHKLTHYRHASDQYTTGLPRVARHRNTSPEGFLPLLRPAIVGLGALGATGSLPAVSGCGQTPHPQVARADKPPGAPGGIQLSVPGDGSETS
jgi:hypothetical protein